MATYLLTWNPDRWQWDDLAEQARWLRAGTPVERRWSVGNSRRPKAGDRCFLMRVGRQPKGIIASGYITTGVFEDQHWSGSNTTARYVQVKFDTLLLPDCDSILSLDDLIHMSPYPWTPQSSGRSIPDSTAKPLEELWEPFSLGFKECLDEDLSRDHIALEGAVKTIQVNAFERDKKLREDCVTHYGLSCLACGFNFEEAYGSLGKGFVHVHHLQPLPQVRSAHAVDPVRDLRPLCPNCHALIHRRRPPYTIDEVRAAFRGHHGR